LGDGGALVEGLQTVVGTGLDADVGAHHTDIQQLPKQVQLHVVGAALDAHDHPQIAPLELIPQRSDARVAGPAQGEPLVVVKDEKAHAKAMVQRRHLIHQVGDAAKALCLPTTDPIEGVYAAKGTVPMATPAAHDR
jgi:hypothetical protein